MIDPTYWLAITRRNKPKKKNLTDWYNGNVAPVRVGMYERYFTDGTYMMYWDGNLWRRDASDKPHWRQVGDYPAWRGLTKQANSSGANL